MPIALIVYGLVQGLALYLLRSGIFESLVIVGLGKLCRKYQDPTLIELTLAIAAALGKRELLGDLKMPPAKEA